jgi:hypothetical protein
MKKKALKINREPQTWPFLKGDLLPQKTDFTDLRNDFAGTPDQQKQNIVLRYLENLPAGDTTDMDTMVGDIARFYPFHGASVEDFRPAVSALETDNLVVTDGREMRINKVGRVARRWLVAKMHSGR